MKNNYFTSGSKSHIRLVYLLGMLSFISLNLRAQDYSVSFAENDYTELTGATKLDVYDTSRTDLLVNINETLTFYGEDSKIGSNDNEMTINKGGAIRVVYSNGTRLMTLSGFEIGTDMIAKSDNSSEISYQINGDFFIAQYKNMGFAKGEPSDYANFQIIIRMYDGSFIVHYGDIQTSSNSFGTRTGPGVGFRQINLENSTIMGFGYLIGEFNSPGIGTKINDRMTGIPDNGTVVQFTKVTASLEESQKEHNMSIYPNPSSDFIKVNLGDKLNSNEYTVEVHNVYGQKVLQQSFLGSEEITMNVKDLPKGNYIVTVVNSDSSTSLQQKFIKI